MRRRRNSSAFPTITLTTPTEANVVSVNSTTLTPLHYFLPEGGGIQGDTRGHSELSCVSSAFGLRFEHHALSTHLGWTPAYRDQLYAERRAALDAGHTVVIVDTTTHAGG